MSFTFGASADYSVAKSALNKYAAACQYTTPEFTVMAKLNEDIAKPDGMIYTGSYYHKVSSKMQVCSRATAAQLSGWLVLHHTHATCVCRISAPRASLSCAMEAADLHRSSVGDA
mmetsp:Transcript_11235/g.34616  ORF Transcript_11235/g.34616 Transcript_11235/m.34616 type:complete len:115 (-) Transcript_11235:1118-1462(-)